jgi:hypothetical protein
MNNCIIKFCYMQTKNIKTLNNKMNKRIYKFCLVMASICCLFTTQVVAQVNTNSIQVNQVDSLKPKNPAQLIREVFLSKVPADAISNIEVTLYGWNGGNKNDGTGSTWDTERGLGYFSKGSSNFPIAEGLIMSTGPVDAAQGPNDDKDALFSNYTGGKDDVDLGPLSGTNIANAAILEFDFIPNAYSMEFEYIFASEEYPYFVSRINDVFGFWVRDQSAVNPTHPTNLNIATIPNNDPSLDPIVVGINTVNNGRYYTLVNYMPEYNYTYTGSVESKSAYSDYFIANPMSTNGGIPYNNQPNPYYYTTQFNGFTVKLKASITGLNPAHTYRLKLAVGNSADNSNGSGVFLAANSFVLGNTLSVIACDVENAGTVYTKTTNNYLRLTRPDIEKDQDAKIAMEYSGDAVNGTDYMTPDGYALPDTILFPAGVDTVSVFFVIPDNATAGRTMTVALAPLYPGAPQTVHNVDITIGSFEVKAGSDIRQGSNNVFTMAAITPNGTWSVVGSDDGVSIANEHSPTTTVTLDTSKRKTATLRWTVSDGDCTYYDDVELNYGKVFLPANRINFYNK